MANNSPPIPGYSVVDSAFTPPAILAGNSGVGGGGLRTVLLGDSHTDWFNYILTSSGMSYDRLTRVLTFTAGSAHNYWPGLLLTFWNRSYASMVSPITLPIAAIPTTTTFTVVLPEGFSDIPNGALAGGAQYRTPAQRGVTNYVNLMQMRLGWPLDIVSIQAQSGAYSGGVLGRIKDVLALKPQLVLMNSLGINDQTYSGIDAPLSFISELDTMRNNRAIYDAILGSGSYLVVGTVQPTTASDARGTKDICDRLLRINDDLWRYAQGKTRMRVFDPHSAIVDPTSAVGAALAANVRVDNVHASMRGAMKITKSLEPLISNIAPNVRSTLPTTLIQSHNTGALAVSSASALNGIVTVIFSGAHKWRSGEPIRVTGMADAAANGVFPIIAVGSTTVTYAALGVADGAIGGTKIISRSNNVYRNNLLATATGGTLTPGSGSLTGVAAAHVRCEVANTSTSYVAVASVAADDSGFGNKQVLAITACAGDGTPRSQFTVPGTSAFATEMSGNGRSYSFECMYRIKSTAWANTPLSDVRGYLTITGSDGKIYQGEAYMGWDGSEATSIFEDQAWHVRTPPVLVPVGVTVSSAVFLLWVRHPAAITGGATLTLELARPAVYDVTDYAASIVA